MKTDSATGLAVLYTLGYLGMVGLLMFFDIPQHNRELLLTLVGLMSSQQGGIIKHFFDGSKAGEKAQIANIDRAAKSESVVQDIAKSAAPTAAAAVAAATGNPVPVIPSTTQAGVANVTADTAIINTTERKEL